MWVRDHQVDKQILDYVLMAIERQNQTKEEYLWVGCFIQASGIGTKQEIESYGLEIVPFAL